MGKIVKKVKSERGSITVFILSTMLVIIAVIFTIYFNKMNKISNQEKELNKIQEEYMQGSTNDIMAHLYEESTANRNATLVRKWVNKIDGNGEEEFLDVEKTSDGGYIAVGYTTSTDIAGLTNKGSSDCLIAKYDANGNEEWKKSVGGSKYDEYSGVIEITDGTYIAVGTISSTDVLDKNGNNIGHGYDWSFNFEGGNYGSNSMTASEGIIGTYDRNGNETSLKTTGKATDKYEGGYDAERYSSINIKIYGIDKVSDGFVITGKRSVGVPSTIVAYNIQDGHLAIKYDKKGNELAESSFKIYDSPYISSDYRSWKGIIEKKDGSYILFGTGYSTAGGTGLWKASSDLKNISEFGDAHSLVKNCLLDKDGNYITLDYTIINMFIRVEKQSNSSMIWEYTDKVIKSISKRNEESFVGISEDDKFLVYDMNDGNVLNEYEIPTYENIYAIEGEDEFILLRYSNK